MKIKLISLPLFFKGGFGYDFTDRANDVEESLKQVSQRLPASGVTSYCPTIVTSTPESYHEVLPRVRNHMRQVQKLIQSHQSPIGSNILGLHLEGPFINSKKRGAHREDFIQDKSPVLHLNQLIDCYGSLEDVCMITFAPELVDDLVIAQLNQLKIVPSIGHCGATLRRCSEALRSGARCITHLYNAMPSFHHREPSVIGSLTLNDRLCLPEVSQKVVNELKNLKQTNGFVQSNGCEKVFNGLSNSSDKKFIETSIGIDKFKTVNGKNEKKPINGINGICSLNGKSETEKRTQLPSQLFYGIICDGVHTVPAAVALAYRAYPEGIILVTDAIAPLGLESGRVHRLGTEDIEIKENCAFLKGTDTLCGSTASLDRCVRLFMESTGCDPVQAVNSATLHPATLLALRGKKGDLSIGSDADFVLLNDQLHVQSTYIGGHLSWSRQQIE